MSVVSVFQTMFWSLICISGLLLPGFLGSRLLGVEPTLPGSLLGSLVLLFHCFFMLQVLGVPINAWTLVFPLAAVCLLFCLFLSRRKAVDPIGAEKAEAMEPAGWLCWLPVLVGLAAIAGRSVLEPLSGWDHLFRWDYLGTLIVQKGHFGFYPVYKPEDFLVYGWTDGIPPLVSFIHAWIYSCLGTTDGAVITPRVLIESVALLFAIRRLASELGGKEAGGAAMAFACSSGLLLWSLVIGQETGLTALSLVSMLIFLRGNSRGAVLMAGVAAGVGALSREYGLFWCVAGLVLLASEGRFLRHGLLFLGACAMVAAPWYLRNWYITGNPLWSNAVLGLFPANATHSEIMGIVAETSRIGADRSLWVHSSFSLLLTSGVLFVSGSLGVVLGWRKMKGLAFCIVSVGLLWLWSVSQTGGGLEYSKRVLAPALSLLAVGGGVWLMRLPECWRRRMLGLLCLLAVDAGIRSLHLPVRPNPGPRDYLSSSWRALRLYTDEAFGSPVWSQVQAAAGGDLILCDGPAYFTVVSKHGGRAQSLYSPTVRFLFEEDETTGWVKLERLRRAGVRFVLLTQGGQITQVLSERHAFFRLLRRECRPVAVCYGQEIYDLSLLLKSR